MATGYAIAWEAGASAQIEIFSPELDPAKDPDYRLKFTPPMRKTIRPPLGGLQLGRGELRPIIASLNKLGDALSARGGPGAAGVATQPSILDQARKAGGMLFTLIIPNYVEIELTGEDLFLEIGVDEALLEYPWELLHDGTEFLCLKHSMGRFVNVSRSGIPTAVLPKLMENGPLSVLVISVPTPQPRALEPGNLVYETLTGVDNETDAIVEAITDLGSRAKVTVLRGRGADWDSVANALKTERYHIIHYSGHAFFNSDTPVDSSLVLYDSDMTTGHIRRLCKKPPVLFFVNGCEATVTQGAGEQWKNRYDIFGLARAFLETGAYLLGSRWKVGDEGAARFAKAFYAHLLEEKPLGRAIREARTACKLAQPADFSWASYVYYGDPRVRFRQVEIP
jgi:CHAT domain-containing protein